MWLTKRESEKALSFLETLLKDIQEGHRRELLLQKQFITIAKRYPKITDDFCYCNECSMFHYPGQHVKQQEDSVL